MKKLNENTQKKIIQFSITGTAIALSITHLKYPELKIDSISIFLLIIAILPWLSPLFKSIELPGGLKVEFQELKNAEEKAKKAGLIKDTPVRNEVKYSFITVASIDPNLALAGLRIEIEKSLIQICERHNIPTGRQGVGQLMRILAERQIISREENAALLDMVTTLNRAAHGHGYDERIGNWAIDFGPKLLENLNEKINAA